MRWHSLWRGIQSVLFYYLSCTPYLKFVNRRNRKKQGKRAELEQQAQILDAPDAYRHPLPFRTNEHWAEEIRLGPGPPPNRLSKKQRQALAQLRPNDTNSNGHTPLNDLSTSKVDLDGGEKTVLSADQERWKARQRGDEPLWGCEEYAPSSVPSMRSGKTGSSSLRFPPYDTGDNSSTNYIVAINPAVNDLHPPVVSNPAHGNVSNMWMLQPPPKAAVMAGHGSPTNRSRSTTASSMSSRRIGEHKLGRKLSERLMEEKLRRGSLLYPNDSPRILYKNLPSQSSLIESKYFDRDISWRTSTRLSTNSTDTVNVTRSIALDDDDDNADGETTTNAQPWRRHEYSNGTLAQDFAFPTVQLADTISHPSPNAEIYRSRHRPRTAPTPTELSDIIGSTDDLDPFETPPSSHGMILKPSPRTGTRRKHQELVAAFNARGLPFMDVPMDSEYDDQFEIARRRSVDF